MDQALPMKTINGPNGDPYISVIDCGGTVGIQVHRYTPSRVVCHFDKRVIPELIEQLHRLQKDEK